MAEHNVIAAGCCPLCQSKRWKAYRFSLRQCEACGLVVNPAIFRSGSAEAVNKEAFGEAYEPETSFWVRWFEAWKNRRYLRTIRRYVSKGRLLEIGIGSGRFLEAAQRGGYDVAGCDLSPSVCRRVEERIGLPVHCGSVDTLPKSSADVVAMHHVLEHVENPVGFLKMVREVLRPGGIVHIAVPNVACWEARFSGCNYYLPHHFTYFCNGTIELAAHHAGLNPRSTHTHESFSTWFLTLVRLSLAIKPNRQPRIAASIGKVPSWWSVVEHPYRLAMVGAGLVTWPIRHVQGKLGRGDELIMVACKGT